MIERWAARAEPFTLRDVAPALIQELGRALAIGQAGAELRQVVERAPRGTGALRELGLLRGIVLDLPGEKGLALAPIEAASLHCAIDDLMVAFAEHATERPVLESEARERFVRMLAHDLRNPISAIKLGASLLLSDRQPAEARRRTVERIASGADRMLRMLEDLPDLVRLGSGMPLPLDDDAISLKELCCEVVDEKAAAHPGQAIRFSADTDVTGRFDRRRLARALGNVISYALERSPAERQVSVRLRSRPGACISVRHHGPAIPSPELCHLFDALGCTDPGGKTRPAEGFGLFLAEQIVRAQGGRILADSSSAGTTIELVLPKSVQ